MFLFTSSISRNTNNTKIMVPQFYVRLVHSKVQQHNGISVWLLKFICIFKIASAKWIPVITHGDQLFVSLINANRWNSTNSPCKCSLYKLSKFDGFHKAAENCMAFNIKIVHRYKHEPRYHGDQIRSSDTCCHGDQIRSSDTRCHGDQIRSSDTREDTLGRHPGVLRYWHLASWLEASSVRYLTICSSDTWWRKSAIQFWLPSRYFCNKITSFAEKGVPEWYNHICVY